MCSFQTLLKNSAVARPLLHLAQWQNNALNSSLPLGSLNKPGNALSKLTPLLSTLLLLMILGLLASLTIFDTGPIGVATWACFLTISIIVLFKTKGTEDNSENRFTWTSVDILIFAFLASAIISTAFSSYLQQSLIGLAKGLTFMAGYWLFRLSSWHYLSHEKKSGPKNAIQKNFTLKNFIWLILSALALLGIIQSVIGLEQYFNHVDARATWVDTSVNPELNMTRIFGTLKPANPNLLAGFLVPCLCSGMALLGLLIQKLGFKKKAWVFLITFIGAIGLVKLALILTGSRGSYLALAGIGITVFAMIGHLLWNEPELKDKKSFRKIWLLTLFGAIALVTVAIMASPQLQHRVASIFAMREDSSISYRLNVYGSVIQMIKDNWLIGIGTGNSTFKLVYGLYMVPGFNALGAYSVPLEILAEQGLIGFSIFSLLIITIIVRSVLMLDEHRSLIEKWLVISLLCGVIGSLMYGVFDTIWYRPSVNLLFWCFVALLTTLSTLCISKEKTP